jgi:hypothetical protein
MHGKRHPSTHLSFDAADQLFALKIMYNRGHLAKPSRMFPLVPKQKKVSLES